MRRLALLTAVAAVLGVVGWLGWRVWTAPPLATAADLAAEAALAPGTADGVLVVAQPAVATRWLARHPQALALVWRCGRRGARARGPRPRPAAGPGPRRARIARACGGAVASSRCPRLSDPAPVTACARSPR